MRLLFLVYLLFGFINTTFSQIQIKGYSNYIKYPQASAISNDDQYFYLVHNKGIGIHKINPQTHLLENIQEVTVKGGAHNLILTKDNQFLITTSYSESSILIYKRNETNGKLTLYQSYVESINGRGSIKEPSHISLSPSGRFLFVDSDRTLSTLKFQDGQLEYLRQNTITNNYHGPVRFSPDNKYVYIENYGEAQNCPRAVLTLDERTGELQTVACLERQITVPGFYYDASNQKRSCYVTPGLEHIVFSPDGTDVYMRGHHAKERGSSTAFVHYRWINGELKVQNVYYNLDEKHQIQTFKSLYIDGSGRYLYILTGGDDSGIHAFRRDPNTGALTFEKSFHKKNNLPRIITPYRMSFSQNNQYIYVSNYFGSNVLLLENKATQPSPLPPTPIIKHDPPSPVINNNSNNNMDYSKNQDSDCGYPKVATNEIVKIEQQLKALESEQARYDYALKNLQNRCLATLQVLRLARLFEVEYIRLEFVKFSYYYTTDLENFYLLDALFTNNRLKQAFQKHIQG